MASWQYFTQLRHKPHVKGKQISPFFFSEYTFQIPNYIHYAFTESYVIRNMILLFEMTMGHLMIDFLDLVKDFATKIMQSLMEEL